MNAAIYARVSTDKQGRDQTIESQLAALRDWAAARGHQLRPEHVFTDEGYSGSRLDRPGLDRLRDAARDGEFDVVAVLSPDRLARKYAYQVLLMEELRRAGCEVAFVQRPISDDPHDQLLLQIQGAIAEYEKAVLGERFRRGKLQKARAGAWVSGRAPYGYRYVPASDGVPGRLMIDEVEAELVRTLYRWLIDERMTVRQILKRLAEGPWRPRCGRRLWSTAVVHHILADSVYAGTAYANRHETIPAARPRSRGPRSGGCTGRRPRPREEWIAIPVPAIIDEPTRLAALAQLERNAALSFRNNTRNDYLLRCLLTCRTCGLAMFGTNRRGGAGKPRHRYYKCRGKDCVTRDPDRPCTQRVTKAEEVEGAVWGHVKQLLDDPAMLLGQFESLAREAEDRDGAAAEARKTEALLRRLDREEQRLLDAYQAEAVSLEELKSRRLLLRGRRQLLEAQSEQQAKLRAEREAARESWHDLEAFCGRVRSRLGEATVGEKQRILQLIIERVIVGEDTVEIRHVIPLRRPGFEATEKGTPDEPHEGVGTGARSLGRSIGRLRSAGVELAPLPRHARQTGVQGGLETGVGVADDQLDPVHPPAGQRGEEVPPVDLGLGERDAHPEDRPLTLRVDPDGDQDRTRADLAAVADVLVAGVQDQVGRLADRAAPPLLQLGIQRLGGPADLGAGDLQAAELLGDGGDLAGGDALDIHLGHGQLQGPLAPDPLLQGRGVELDAPGLRDLDGQRPDPGVDGLGLEAEWH